ncbi:MAG: ABC transporter permease subunit [Gammaproteobacteria bacterium]|nr:ABC transporter permease subunit [Gammaproteobacteria bacterium]MCP4924544.1 ABC transporter permease subunit [Gammaproteobacteria bacterium]
MNYNWDWGVLIREPYFEWLVSGFLWTISVSIAAWVLAFSLGSVVGIARTTDSKILRGIGTCYVETFRNVPPLTSEFLTIFKNSSLALTIGVLETTAQARQIEEYTFQGFEAFTAATLMYIVVTSTVMLLMKSIAGRVRIPGMISLGAK